MNRHQDFSFCPICGSLMPYSLNKIKNFFEVYNIHPSLKRALNLVYKSEFEAAAREAFVILETELRKKSGLDSHGFDLATKALKFEVDSKSGVVTKPPLIAINDLKTKSDRNENGAKVKEALPADVPTLIREVRRVGCNIDQLLVIARAKNWMIAKNLEKALERSRAVEKLIVDTYTTPAD